MSTLKIFYFRYDSRAETRAKLRMDLYFVKLIMQKVSYIHLKNILTDDPLPRMSKNRLNFRSQRRLSVHGFCKCILASTVHEQTTLVT